jgi:hypothetical protein
VRINAYLADGSKKLLGGRSRFGHSIDAQGPQPLLTFGELVPIEYAKHSLARRLHLLHQSATQIGGEIVDDEYIEFLA